MKRISNLLDHRDLAELFYDFFEENKMRMTQMNFLYEFNISWEDITNLSFFGFYILNLYDLIKKA